MLAELDEDLAQGTLYISPRLSAYGIALYPDLLRSAITDGDIDSLTSGLRQPGVLNDVEYAKNPRGGPMIEKKMADNAARMLAEGEFNRFYARGVCQRVLAEDYEGQVRVYRARDSANRRPESEALDQALLPARLLLEDLRSSVGVEPALRLPPGPNSGMSIRLP